MIEDEIAWRDALCTLCRFRPAKCLLDDNELLCIGCADLVLERAELVATVGRDAWKLASLAEVARL